MFVYFIASNTSIFSPMLKLIWDIFTVAQFSFTSLKFNHQLNFKWKSDKLQSNFDFILIPRKKSFLCPTNNTASKCKQSLIYLYKHYDQILFDISNISIVFLGAYWWRHWHNNKFQYNKVVYVKPFGYRFFFSKRRCERSAAWTCAQRQRVKETRR